MTGRALLLLICLMGLAFVGGCSPYVEGLHYVPQPAVLEVRAAAAATQPADGAPQQQQPPPLTVYATIIGVRYEDEKQHMPLSVEVRMRLDNHGPQEVAFDPRTLELIDARLARFPSPILATPQSVALAPEQSAVLQANFPFPPGASFNNPGMETLQLHWAVRVGDQVVPQTVTFRRMHYSYYDFDSYYGPYWWTYPPYPVPYPYPYPGFGATIVVP